MCSPSCWHLHLAACPAGASVNDIHNGLILVLHLGLRKNSEHFSAKTRKGLCTVQGRTDTKQAKVSSVVGNLVAGHTRVYHDSENPSGETARKWAKQLCPMQARRQNTHSCTADRALGLELVSGTYKTPRHADAPPGVVEACSIFDSSSRLCSTRSAASEWERVRSRALGLPVKRRF